MVVGGCLLGRRRGQQYVQQFADDSTRVGKFHLRCFADRPQQAAAAVVAFPGGIMDIELCVLNLIFYLCKGRF